MPTEWFRDRRWMNSTVYFDDVAINDKNSQNYLDSLDSISKLARILVVTNFGYLERSIT